MFVSWLDILLLAGLAASGFAGARVGIFWAAMAFGSLLLSWYFAGNISGAASLAITHYTESPTVHAVVHALIYAALFAVVLYAASRMLAVIKAFLATATFGASNVIDRLGGLALGLFIGLALIGAVVLVGARLTYQVDFSEIDLDVPGSVEERVRQGETVLEGVEGLLTSSAIARAIIRAGSSLPGDALGLAPMELGDSLQLLDRSLD